MNLFKLMVIGFAFTVSFPSFANDNGNGHRHVSNNVIVEDSDGLDALMDMPMRLGGFVQTVVGTGVFVGISPITAFMNLYPPHNSFEKVAEYLVVRPARYTFNRPVGVYDYDSRP